MRFYGGSVSEWEAVPAGRLYDLLTLADRLEARERLKRVTDAQCASSYAKKGDVERHVRSLERQAAGRRERQGSSLAQLEAMGIQVERVTADG